MSSHGSLIESQRGPKYLIQEPQWHQRAAETLEPAEAGGRKEDVLLLKQWCNDNDSNVSRHVSKVNEAKRCPKDRFQEPYEKAAETLEQSAL